LAATPLFCALARPGEPLGGASSLSGEPELRGSRRTCAGFESLASSLTRG